MYSSISLSEHPAINPRNGVQVIRPSYLYVEMLFQCTRKIEVRIMPIPFEDTSHRLRIWKSFGFCQGTGRVSCGKIASALQPAVPNMPISSSFTRLQVKKWVRITWKLAWLQHMWKDVCLWKDKVSSRYEGLFTIFGLFLNLAVRRIIDF